MASVIFEASLKIPIVVYRQLNNDFRIFKIFYCLTKHVNKTSIWLIRNFLSSKKFQNICLSDFRSLIPRNC